MSLFLCIIKRRKNIAWHWVWTGAVEQCGHTRRAISSPEVICIVTMTRASNIPSNATIWLRFASIAFNEMHSILIAEQSRGQRIFSIMMCAGGCGQLWEKAKYRSAFGSIEISFMRRCSNYTERRLNRHPTQQFHLYNHPENMLGSGIIVVHWTTYWHPISSFLRTDKSVLRTFFGVVI